MPAEEGGTQSHGPWSLWNTGPGFGHMADLADQGWGGNFKEIKGFLKEI